MTTTNDSYQALLNDSTTIGPILSQINVYKNNPSGIQRVGLNYLSGILSGQYDVVDPSNPFVYLMSVSALNTAAAVIDNEATTRQLYPVLAQTEDDVYRHMSDEDYVGRFATPSTTNFTIVVQQSELLNKMVTDPTTGLRTAIIPRNTTFTVAGVTFSLQYPIKIMQMSHGAIQITYDATITSPLQTLSTNIVDWKILTPVGSADPWIAITVQAQQFFISTTQAAVTVATGQSQVITLSDSFYYARVYMKSGTSTTWTEIQTTHSQQVYDPLKPTAALKVINGTLQVKIPQIYLDSGLVSGTLRVDVYQTKGALTMVMENYSVGDFVANWYAIDTNEQTDEAAVFTSLRAMMVYSTDIVSGGAAALSFDTLRSQVINNSVGQRQTPITTAQMTTVLQNEGYQVTTDVDVVTNRVFLATRSLPDPTNTSLLTAAAASMQTLTISAEKAVAYSGVYNNDTRVTLSPDLIYQDINGVLTPVSTADHTALTKLSGTALASAVNSGNYVYTPFHYVLDMSSDLFQVRPYYLDSPEAVSITFGAHNDTTGLQVNSKSYSIEKTSTGYVVSVVVTSNAAYKALSDSSVGAILAYTPPNETDIAYLTGKLVSLNSAGERIFQFSIATNFDIDSNNYLQTSSFEMYDTSTKTFGTPLENTFSIFYTTTGSVDSAWVSSTMDTYLPSWLVAVNTKAITEEQITLLFGYALTTLWARSRSLTSSAPYKTYSTDIPLLYEKDVYETDPVTGGAFSIDPTTKQIVYTKLHSAGDPVLNASGQPVYQHRAGDTILDADGSPVLNGAASISRSIDLFLIDATYLFATDAAAVSYRQTVVDTVVGWLTNELSIITPELLEQTNLYFYPKTTQGQISVVADSGVTTTIEAGQTLIVNLYVSASVYSDSTIRSALEKSTITTVASILQDSQISLSGIHESLAAIYGSDVLAISISGLGGSENYSAVTVINERDRCSLAKLLVALPDGTLVVQENITVNFVKHDVTSAATSTAVSLSAST
jgi:hypothetical protein